MNAASGSADSTDLHPQRMRGRTLFGCVDCSWLQELAFQPSCMFSTWRSGGQDQVKADRYKPRSKISWWKGGAWSTRST